MLQEAIPFLPIGHVEARHVEARLFHAGRILRQPRLKAEGELLGGKHVLEPGAPVLHTTTEGGANAGDFEAVQTVEALADGFVVQAGQPIGRGAVPEIAFLGAFPTKVRRVFRVHAKEALLLFIAGLEAGLVDLLKRAFAIFHGVVIRARFCGHEANAKGAAIGGIAKAVHGERLFAFQVERAIHGHVGERVLRVRLGDLERDFEVIVASDFGGRGGEGDAGFGAEAGEGKHEQAQRDEEAESVWSAPAER